MPGYEYEVLSYRLENKEADVASHAVWGGCPLAYHAYRVSIDKNL